MGKSSKNGFNNFQLLTRSLVFSTLIGLTLSQASAYYGGAILTKAQRMRLQSLSSTAASVERPVRRLRLSLPPPSPSTVASIPVIPVETTSHKIPCCKNRVPN